MDGTLLGKNSFERRMGERGRGREREREREKISSNESKYHFIFIKFDLNDK